MTENADIQSRNQELQSRNQTKDRELAEAQQQLREKVGLAQENQFFSSGLQEEQMAHNADLQSRMHRELAEAQQQLREKVSIRNTHIFWCIKKITAGRTATIQ